LTSLREIKMY